MESLLAPSGSVHELACSLTRIAADPVQTVYLHKILGTYCHEYRNCLNSLKMSLYLAQRCATGGDREIWCDLEASYLTVEHLVDRLQAICRPVTVSPVSLPLSLLFEDGATRWSRELEAKDRRFLMVPPDESVVGGFDPLQLGKGFDALVAWRATQGGPHSDLRVQWSAGDGQFRVVWDEPAREPEPEAPPETNSADAIDETPCIGPLSVPLLGRLMALHGGGLRLTGNEHWRLELHWPQAALSR